MNKKQTLNLIFGPKSKPYQLLSLISEGSEVRLKHQSPLSADPPDGFLPQATLSLLLDHLSLVASFSPFNRMTHQNLAVCFGPVLLTPTQEAYRGAGRGGRGAGKSLGPGEEIANAVDFKRHIEALHYLLQLWPGDALNTHSRFHQNIHVSHSSYSSSVPTHRAPADHPSPPSSPTLTQHLQVHPPSAEGVVSRRGRGGLARLESPPPVNRYAGDWTVCGRDVLSEYEADYDEVAGSESEGGTVLKFFRSSGSDNGFVSQHFLFQAAERKKRRRCTRCPGHQEQQEVCS